MLYLISYDVATTTKLGQKRLRQVAKICENYGIRVQNSVFECVMSYEIYLMMIEQLKDIIKQTEDSVRIYPLGKNGRDRIVHLGLDRSVDVEAPLII